MLKNIPWIASGYFAMALTSTMLVSVSTIMLKNIGMSNAEATAYSSLFYIAYAIKPLFSPIVEMFKNKKFFVISAQTIICMLFIFASFLFESADDINSILFVFGCMSIFGMLQDVATDGVFITSLNTKEQSKSSGFACFSWCMGSIAASGLMVSLAGIVHDSSPENYSLDASSWVEPWRVVLLTVGIIMALVCFFNRRYLPLGSQSKAQIKSLACVQKNIFQTFSAFFNKKYIISMICFVFFYRLSEGFVDKVYPLFLIDTVENGGLGLSNTALGILNGGIGLGAFLLGSILGGILVSKHGLKSTLLLLCCAVNLPNVAFLLMAISNTQNLYLISVAIGVEKFFYGIGATGHMLYMMQQLSPGKFQTAHFAFGTGLLSLCMWATGTVSGLIEGHLGYVNYFWFVLFATIPSFYFTLKAPFNEPDLTDVCKQNNESHSNQYAV